MVEGLLGVRMPRRPRIVGAQGNLWTRILAWLTDWRTWTTMLYMVLQLPLGIIYFTLTVTGVAVSAGLIAVPFVQMIFGTPIARTYGYAYYIEPWGMPLLVLAGLLGLVVTLWMVKGIGLLHGQYAKSLLVGRVDVSAGAQSGLDQPPAVPAATATMAGATADQGGGEGTAS